MSRSCGVSRHRGNRADRARLPQKLATGADEDVCAGLLDGPAQTLAQADRWLPTKDLLGQGDVGPPLLGIVGRQRLEHDLRARARQVDDRLCQLEEREL